LRKLEEHTNGAGHRRSIRVVVGGLKWY